MKLTFAYYQSRRWSTKYQVEQMVQYLVLFAVAVVSLFVEQFCGRGLSDGVICHLFEYIVASAYASHEVSIFIQIP